MPPLTYFAAGTVSISDFFRFVSERAACGLVFDIGHLWTVYRYTGSWKSRALEQFAEGFLATFPLERVVEIHVAGLTTHESSLETGTRMTRHQRDCELPYWTDAHMAPIPSVLFDLLDQVLHHPRLTALKGLALEVDTKPIELIVDEFDVFLRRYRDVLPEREPAASGGPPVFSSRLAAGPSVDSALREEVRKAYDRYARVVSGRMDPAGDEWTGPFACLEDLDRYRSVYLPYEIVRWGGDVEAMFPEVCCRLAERGVDLSRFVSFWFREPRASAGSYDFFLIKIERFLEFVHEAAPELDAVAAGEAEELRRAYAAANEPVVPAVDEV
jgi:hypothetical protein